MSDNAELHNTVMGFLGGQLAKKEGRQCMSIELCYRPGNGFKDEPIRKWVRADDPEQFENMANVERLVTTIIEIAEGEADTKPAGKHTFILKTRQHHGDIEHVSFSLKPAYTGGGGEETALVPGGVGSRDQGVIANHAGQLMRINAQMFEGTIRVLGQQNMSLHEQVTALTSENATLRKELEDARSNKMDREFQIAMAAEKNNRTNQGFQKILQIGTIVAAKMAGGNEGEAGVPNPLAMLLGEFGKSLRPDQIQNLMGILDMSQKMLFMEIMNQVKPPEEGPAPGVNGSP